PAFTGMTGFWVVVIYRENGNPYAVIPAQMICCPSTQNKKQSCNILIYIVIFIYVYLRYANARLHKYIRVTV
ncbi:TPA: hypothetical protein ACLAZL_002153, partial [Neisseria meningitidis]